MAKRVKRIASRAKKSIKGKVKRAKQSAVRAGIKANLHPPTGPKGSPYKICKGKKCKHPGHAASINPKDVAKNKAKAKKKRKAGK